MPFEVVDAGHVYKLSSGETITFIKRSQGQLVHDGIQNEELLQVIIDRMEFLQETLPCIENSITLTHLYTALDAQVLRTTTRIAQGVEATDKPHTAFLPPITEYSEEA